MLVIEMSLIREISPLWLIANERVLDVLGTPGRGVQANLMSCFSLTQFRTHTHTHTHKSRQVRDDVGIPSNTHGERRVIRTHSAGRSIRNSS